ncbi:putative ATPase [Peptoclostridium litorale DSM 5388]|uniref:AAA ATPase domain-containing protein n=1 Tax=Peptoclostridium litorale DSM 5388 TaxID=1121324 RepID=A0A069RIW5_PEPLI|nr:replication-associated recombination protein A [Peptoclostridium litorale]KDR94172.1 AAA ATPase domain-containing protein [Peptoclostridium litorale DSM 5388]SIN81818.1 putative ATPase [Peptoclostridium litorale DSM 5388]
MLKPLAERMRPAKIEDMIGQSHIIGKGKALANMINAKRITNMILYGPSGTGKTSLANIISHTLDMEFFNINATTSSVSDIKQVISKSNEISNVNGIILYIDEIQSFNKKQQQTILEYIENGKITLIASTTENPHHYVYNALLSRSIVFEFKPLGTSDIVKGLQKAIGLLEEDEFDGYTINYEKEAFEKIAVFSNGDLRKAINILEAAMFSLDISEDMELTLVSSSIENGLDIKMISYDRSGDNHYDILSAFQKSIRGSDVDASLHYLARLIKAGDLQSITRRLIVIASEDIGLAYPNAISIVKACTDSANQLGFPEARIPLAQAVILLASSPKSNSVLTAIDRALSDIESKDIGQIPMHIRDSHYRGSQNMGRGVGYKYPHNYENSYVHQKYMPENIQNSKYYTPADNKFEKSAFEYLNSIKKKGV